MKDFVVYVETNWLVACVLPHDKWRQGARELLDAAEKGTCTLRLPEVAFLEGPHVVERETQDHARSVVDICKEFDAVARNLQRADVQDLVRKVLEIEKTYRLADPRQELEAVMRRCRGFAFRHVDEEQRMLDDLRPHVTLEGKDICDLHILAAIAADRLLDPTSPAAVISTNSKQFSVSGTNSRLPREFYASQKLVYLDKFNLRAAQTNWQREDGRGWQAPVPSAEDPRIQEAQRLLRNLPEARRDEALQVLRGLQ